MIATMQHWSANSLRRSRRARIFAVVCATIAFVSVTTSSQGQSSKAQSESEAGEWKSATVSDMPTRSVRFASNQKQPATTTSKSATTPTKQPTRKPATKKAAAAELPEPTPSDASEELPLK